jgi:hypothetical protein
MPDLDDNLSRRTDVMAQEMPDGTVLVDMMNGRCWELNRVGGGLWSLLAAPTTLRRVCEILSGRYDVEPAVLQRDVIALADDLVRAGLIVSAEPSFRDRLVVESIGDEGLLIDLETGSYFRLNTVATKACLALQQSGTVAAAAARLTEQRGLPPDQARALVESVRAQLAAPNPQALTGNRFAYRRRQGGYALEQDGTPILTTDARGDELQMIVPPEALAFPIEQYVRAMTPKLLHLRGLTVIHASACESAGGLTAFSGQSGAGKTTTARALAAAAARLISEDIVVFGPEQEGQPLVFDEGERHAHAWARDAAERLSRDPTARVACRGLEAMSDGPRRPLHAIWFLDARRRSGDTIALGPLAPMDGLLMLLANNFLGAADPESCRRHVRETHRLARAVSLWQATVPDGLEALAAAAARYSANSAS